MLKSHSVYIQCNIILSLNPWRQIQKSHLKMLHRFECPQNRNNTHLPVSWWFPTAVLCRYWTILNTKSTMKKILIRSLLYTQNTFGESPVSKQHQLRGRNNDSKEASCTAKVFQNVKKINSIGDNTESYQEIKKNSHSYCLCWLEQDPVPKQLERIVYHKNDRIVMTISNS